MLKVGFLANIKGNKESFILGECMVELVCLIIEQATLSVRDIVFVGLDRVLRGLRWFGMCIFWGGNKLVIV